MPPKESTIRRLATADSLEELTRLLHEAYAAHASAGRRFFASYQSVDDTRHRVSKGECWLAFDSESIVGTVTIAVPHIAPRGYPGTPGSGTFYQMAVLPAYQRRGLGSQLLQLAEQRIGQLGAKHVVIDTSSLATELIDWYVSKGYVAIGRWQWNVRNDDSIVLSKALAD